MGEGINLIPLVTKLVIVEMEFRPAAMLQTEKRIHRIGTISNVSTFWMCTHIPKMMEEEDEDVPIAELLSRPPPKEYPQCADDWMLKRINEKLKINYKLVGEKPSFIKFGIEQEVKAEKNYKVNDKFEERKNRKLTPDEIAKLEKEQDEEVEEQPNVLVVSEYSPARDSLKRIRLDEET
jgi:hypothetical protein